MTPERIVLNPNYCKAKYPVYIGFDLLQNIENYLVDLNFSKLVVITDEAMQKIYGENLKNDLRKKGFTVELIAFPCGEQYKTRETKAMIEDKMLELGCDSRTIILSLGGGTVGDVAGFVAATYMRGISHILIPTTLLAMVDSSVGGRNGLNTKHGKNLIGTVWQPKSILMDLNFLRGLPEIHLRNGLFEVVKTFLTSNKKMFSFLEKNLDGVLAKEPGVLEKLLVECTKTKGEIMYSSGNDNELTIFGHTVGYGLEHGSSYQILHGYAVGLGMIVETRLAGDLKLLGKDEQKRVEKLLIKLGADISAIKKCDIEDILRIGRTDKRSRNGQARYVLLTGIGSYSKKDGEVMHAAPESLVKNILHALRSEV